MQDEVLKSRGAGPVHEVLRDLLSAVQVCSFWDLRKQARVPLLQRQEECKGQAQMPLKWMFRKCGQVCVRARERERVQSSVLWSEEYCSLFSVMGHV